MNVQTLRVAVASAYPGDRWRKRVESMPDYQIVAIYNHFVRDGAFNKPMSRFGKKKLEDEKNSCKQFTLWDYGIDPMTGSDGNA